MKKSHLRVDCGKVLIYIPVAAASSLELYRPLAQELATKGHQVTKESWSSRKALLKTIWRWHGWPASPSLRQRASSTLWSTLPASHLCSKTTCSCCLCQTVRYGKSSKHWWSSTTHWSRFVDKWLNSARNLSPKVHRDAMNDYELWSQLQCQNEDCKFDLIITSPLFNEIGVMLGKTLNFQT